MASRCQLGVNDAPGATIGNVPRIKENRSRRRIARDQSWSRFLFHDLPLPSSAHPIRCRELRSEEIRNERDYHRTVKGWCGWYPELRLGNPQKPSRMRRQRASFSLVLPSARVDQRRNVKARLFCYHARAIALPKCDHAGLVQFLLNGRHFPFCRPFGFPD